jgi:hypothetical protein
MEPWAHEEHGIHRRVVINGSISMVGYKKVIFWYKQLQIQIALSNITIKNSLPIV